MLSSPAGHEQELCRCRAATALVGAAALLALPVRASVAPPLQVSEDDEQLEELDELEDEDEEDDDEEATTTEASEQAASEPLELKLVP